MYDLSYPETGHNIFKKCDWLEFYRNANKAIHVNAPEPQYKDVDICIFVDGNHAGEKVSHRLRSGFIM